MGDPAGPRDPVYHRNIDSPWAHLGEERFALTQLVRRLAGIDSGQQVPDPPAYLGDFGGSGHVVECFFDGRRFKASHKSRTKALDNLTRKMMETYPDLISLLKWRMSQAM